MFAFIENLFLKNKARKILSYIEGIEEELTLFDSINNSEDKNIRLVNSLSKNKLYADIVSRYNVCIQKIERHNQEIQTLMFAYNTILQTYPIDNILDNILEFSREKIEEFF